MSDFTWGDTVRVNEAAEPMRRPGSLAEVVGLREIEDETQARCFGAAIGTKLYLIEFGDGVSIEIPEAWIKAVDT